MKYIFELNHPKHYYQFKYVMQLLRQNGHEILVLARDKDVLLKVLDEEGVPYKIFGEHRKKMWAKIASSLSTLFKYSAIVKEFKPMSLFQRHRCSEHLWQTGTMPSRLSSPILKLLPLQTSTWFLAVQKLLPQRISLWIMVQSISG